MKLIIRNTGIVPIEAFTLMGVSTKRNDEDKIGMFGTGFKYGISVLLRDNHSVKIVCKPKNRSAQTIQFRTINQEFKIVYFE